MFALGFVGLGVGSGNSAGLDQIWNGIFGGGSGDSITKLQKAVAKNPKDAASYLKLAQALTAKQRYDEAVTALERYTKLRPRSTQGLSLLAQAYQQQAQTYYQQAVDASNAAQASDPGAPFLGSSSSQFGLSSPSSTTNQAQQQAQSAYQAAVAQYQSIGQKAVGVYEKISSLEPDDPSAMLQVGQQSENFGLVPTAIDWYKRFLKTFPDDASAPAVKQRLKQLEKGS